MNNRSNLLSAIACGALCSAAAGQSCAWTNAARAPGYWGYTGAIAYDTRRGVMVLMQNDNPDGPTAVTSEWNGSGGWAFAAIWGPPGTVGHAMAYDESRGRTICFGGFTSDEGLPVEYYNQTIEWDGHTWHLAHNGSGIAPSRRVGAAMAYDSVRARIMLFGGASEVGQSLGDLWEWNGAAWTDRTSAGPTSVGNAALAYDSARETLVLIKNYETWEWPSATQTWTPRVSGSGPTLIWGAAYHAARQRTVVTAQSGTWEWDGQTWTSGAGLGLTYGPASAPAYDAVRQRIVSIGLATIYPFVSATLIYHPGGYVNCDQSSVLPVLNVNDFQCFLNRFAAQDPYANCDNSTAPPVLNANDFQCFLTKFAAGCP